MCSELLQKRNHSREAWQVVLNCTQHVTWQNLANLKHIETLFDKRIQRIFNTLGVSWYLWYLFVVARPPGDLNFTLEKQAVSVACKLHAVTCSNYMELQRIANICQLHHVTIQHLLKSCEAPGWEDSVGDQRAVSHWTHLSRWCHWIR